MAYVRTVKTRSSAVAVQIVWSSRRGSRRIEHLGSAHDGSELEARAQSRQPCLRQGETMTTAAMVAYAHDQIDHARTELEHPT